MIVCDHEMSRTDETLKEIRVAALLHRTADDVQQVSISITIACAQVTLGTEDATSSSPLPSTCL